MSPRPHILGVRHHSPACARLVRRRILKELPARVLIEGPSDFNPDRHQLLLDHRLPIAVFSSQGGLGGRYSPFCDYSPEWVALRTAHQIGADFLFIDHPFCPSEAGPPSSPLFTSQLARRLGYDNHEALWDAMVEQAAEETLEENLAEYFRLLRQQVGEWDDPRERFMAQAVAWACSQGTCLVVCGGLHALYLEEKWRDFPPEWPAQPTVRSFLVPFSFERLSSLNGYQAGMTCPEYYQQLWEVGWEGASQYCLRAAADALRGRQQLVSTADLVAVSTQAEGLRRLRGHRYALRCDLLDALLSSLCKEALEEVPPWSGQDSRLQLQGRHPQLAALLSAFSGCRRGTLCPSTPRPPLVFEVEEGFRHYQLQPTRPPRQVMTIPDTEPSRFLRRLEILQLPGIQCLFDEPETWSLFRHDDFEAFLLEASAFGADLKEASGAALQAAAPNWEGAVDIARGLQLAMRAGLEELGKHWLLPLAGQLSRQLRLEELAPALDSLALTLTLFPRLDPEAKLLQAGLDRLLWLLEGQLGAPEAAVEAIRVSKNLLRHPNRSPAVALEVMTRLACQSRAAVRGAALGLIWSLRGQPPQLLEAVRGIPELGDFLWGLFRLAREEVLGQVPLLRAIHDHLLSLDGDEFMVQLPGLRQAFQEFPPRQKEQLALLLAPWLGLDNPRELIQGQNAFDSATMQRAVLLDLALEQEMQSLGW